MPLFHGVLPGIVVDNVDPLAQGRVKVRVDAVFPPRHTGEIWVRVATLMAGDRRGSWFMPDIDDEVLVACDAYDSNLAYMVGALWSDARRPPETMQAGNYKKVLRSRNGVEVTLNDENGQESFVIETPGGQKVTLEDGRRSVEIKDANGNVLELDSGGITVNASSRLRVQSAGTVEIEDANGNGLKLDAAGITVNASSKLRVQSAGTVEISCSMLTVNAGMSRFSGVVQCDTMISNSVVSASYTPGAGNIQ